MDVLALLLLFLVGFWAIFVLLERREKIDSRNVDYINEFRIKASIEMLKDPKNDHLKMSAIAYACGFNSVPTFNTLFKKTYNTTPSTYRRRSR